MLLIDRYDPEEGFARVPELAEQTDSVLRQLDRWLEDDALFQGVRADLARRSPQTTCHGRHSTPVEVLLRLLVVQHLYNLELSGGRTAGRGQLGAALVLPRLLSARSRCDDAAALGQHAATRDLACAAGPGGGTGPARQGDHRPHATAGRDGGPDGDSSPHRQQPPRGRGARPQPGAAAQQAARPGAGRRRRRRLPYPAAQRAPGLQTLHRLARRQGEEAAEARAAVSTKLVAVTERTVSQVERVREALDAAVARGADGARRLAERLDHFVPVVKRVIAQARRRVLLGEPVPSAEQVVSLFEPPTRIIPRYKGGATVEFGRLPVLDEVEGGIVTRFHLLGDQTAEQGELGPALDHHQASFGRPPTLVAGDRGTHHADHERLAPAAGVKHLVIPRSGRLTPAQRERERSRAWRRRSRFRAGIEGRISSLRRDYGLRRCPYHGEAGMERCVGGGIIASNLRHIAQHLAA